MKKSGVALLAIAVLLVVGGLRVADLVASRDRTLRTAEARAANLAFILSEYVAESFAAGDASLRQLAVHSRRIGGPTAPDDAWMPSLQAARVGLPNLGAISVTDAAGVIRHSTQPAIVGQSRATDFAFKRLAESAADELIVSEPFQTVVDPNLFVIPIARRLTTPSGAFDGVVAASVLPATPRGFFRTVDVGEHGIVTVFHPTGVVLFREPAPPGKTTGMRGASDPVFAAAAARGVDGRVEGPLQSGGPVYVSAFRVLQTPPLYVAVSLERDEVLADWRREQRALFALALVVGITVAATLIALFRQMDAKFLAEQRSRLASDEASRLKEEFLATVSHELRTPLQAILGWTHVLQAEGNSDPETAATALETIERNVAMQTRLIDDLLDVSRAVRGNLRLELQPVDPVAIASHVVDAARPAASAKGLRLSLTTTVTPQVMADPDRLQQIVWNLVSNAIKFTPEGGRVDVSVAAASGGVELVVADTGIGIAPSFLAHAFDRFRQADASTTRRYSGLGLGLAIVRHLAELHGATVSAESAGENQGATFRVRFPAAATVAARH